MGLIIKENPFSLAFNEKGKEDATSQVNLYKVKKKLNKSEKYGINRILLSLWIASIFLKNKCFVF